MISSITGEITSIETDRLTIAISGLGFDVAVTKTLAVECHVGQVISLYTHLVVREDLLALYGFKTSEEKAFFLLLLGVEGIGPRIALGTLSVLSPDAIRRAVVSERPEIFSRAPGIGKKTAQKILIQLQGKIKATGDMEVISPLDEIDTQVMEALTTLGYSIVEAQSAIQALPADAPADVEERLRLALQYFNK